MNRPVTVSKRRIATGNAGSRETLASMARLSSDGAHDPHVVRAAQNAVRHVPEGDHLGAFSALLQDVRRRMRYTHDPLNAEVVKAPRFVVDQSDIHGVEPMDCDDASTLLAAMLGAIGYRSEFVTVASDGSRPGVWSHVYVVGVLPNGQRIAMDPIVRRFGVGEEVPDGHLTSPRAYHRGAAMYGLGDPINSAITTASTMHLQSVQKAARQQSEQSWLDSFAQGVARAAKVGEGYFDAEKQKALAATEQARLRAEVRLARLAAKQRAADAPTDGFFTDAEGKTKWVNVGLVALVGIGVVFAVTRK